MHKEENSVVTFNRFLFTRDDEDYGYRIHTDNIPSGLINEAMAMIDMPDKTDFTHMSTDDWKKQYLIMPTGERIIVSRIINTGDLDPFSRPIVSFEGISITPGGYRGIIEVLNVVHMLNSNISIYESWKNGDNSISVDVPLICNPIREYTNEELDDLGIHGELKLLYERLHLGLLNTDKNIVICDDQKLYSEYLSSLYSANIYDMGKDYTLKAETPSSESHLPVAGSGRICQVFIKFTENRKGLLGYEWLVKDLTLNTILEKTSWKYLDRDTDISLIISQGEKIKKHYMLMGWQVLECSIKEDAYGFNNFSESF